MVTGDVGDVERQVVPGLVSAGRGMTWTSWSSSGIWTLCCARPGGDGRGAGHHGVTQVGDQVDPAILKEKQA